MNQASWELFSRMSQIQPWPNTNRDWHRLVHGYSNHRASFFSEDKIVLCLEQSCLT